MTDERSAETASPGADGAGAGSGRADSAGRHASPDALATMVPAPARGHAGPAAPASAPSAGRAPRHRGTHANGWALRWARSGHRRRPVQGAGGA